MTASPPLYDQAARRPTPLALKLAARIRREGPIPVAAYMQACLQDPQFGYYVRRPALGAAGDFITAPEISQIFGELIGLWCVVVWEGMGRPAAFDLVELGPGRGTLLRDALRAAQLRPAFAAAAHVRLVETNAVLRGAQRDLLAPAHAAIEWTGDLATATRADRPAIVIANEFLDTAPVAQFVRRTDQSWGERCVTLDAEGRLQFDDSAAAIPGIAASLDRAFPGCPPGTIAERAAPPEALGPALARSPTVAALFIDYGHGAPATGDTLQAVRGHAPEHPLCSPGEADLTAYVDFAAVGATFAAAGLAIDGPVTQAEFLGRLGIIERARRLMAAAPAEANTIEMAVARLMAPTGMGGRFLALGVRTTGLARLPGL